eukprot:TRINITY_DN15833_c0_g1_i3.p1 TRINITY_DN15833_c0_g1~~TRINITY_DN15833_c0_g1_i3.p1  ORF type:complete len:532 (-),score=145.35 TRINITY_DN15833_c0_g1_i3:13-1608(-)
MCIRDRSTGEHQSAMDGVTLGVTAPISTKPPTPEDLRATEALEAHLHALNALESEECQAKRRDVLEQLTCIAQAWAGELSAQRGLPELADGLAAVRLEPFGSFQLGVAGPDADVDIVCVVPRHIERADFFGGLVPRLAGHPGVRALNAVAEAKVPVLKFYYEEVQIDMLFARLLAPRLHPALDLQDDAVLQGLDEASVSSLNGCRVAHQLLLLVPQPMHSFRLALRFIKAWAVRRNVYSNVQGFFSGVSLAILTARVAQLYPAASASVLVTRFFRLFEQWSWPRPVLLRHAALDPVGVSLKSWNPVYNKKDRLHIFPVITPAQPSVNTMGYASPCSLQVMLAEIKRGAQLTLQIESAPQGSSGCWGSFFEDPCFFQHYKHYLCVQLAATTQPQLQLWAALVESRLRVLASTVRRAPAVQLVHTHPEGHAVPGTAEYRHCVCFFMGLQLDNSLLPLELTKPRADFIASATSWAGYSERHMRIHIRHYKQRELPSIQAASREPPQGKHGKKRAPAGGARAEQAARGPGKKRAR